MRKHQDVYFCPSCGRDMIYLKQVPCIFCTHCSFTQYMDNVVRKDKPAFEVTDSSIAYVGNSTNTARKAWIKSGEDPRSYSSFNKQSVLSNGSSSAPDVEARAIAEKNNIRIVDYVEDMPK
jgi:DNA-directed RNA polymerase subunit RPC12/RpoP